MIFPGATRVLSLVRREISRSSRSMMKDSIHAPFLCNDGMITLSSMAYLVVVAMMMKLRNHTRIIRTANMRWTTSSPFTRTQNLLQRS